MVIQVSPLPLQTPHWSSVVLESTIQSQPTFCKYEGYVFDERFKIEMKFTRSTELTLQMPDMHISFVPILQGVPSAAESPHGTIKVSSESVQ